MSAVCIMVLGTSSGAGKSWLATALCRHYARQGLVVRPFKAQNMSNNVRLVSGPDGGWAEIGTAQYLQALAARTRPDVRMSPLLLKPVADTDSQVVLLGQPAPQLATLPWRERAPHVWPHIADALDGLRATADLVVIEGAGSPAEINLMDSDVVNLRVARHADARCLLATDIDRGGAFAHLYGTWALLPQADRQRLRGFVLNRFRGDARLLTPAPERLQELTGVPTLAVVPMCPDHGLPQEDGVFDSAPAAGAAARTRIAVLAWPRIGRLDEFEPLRQLTGVQLVWARQPQDLVHADWLIVPGSQAPVTDLAWLRERGLDRAVAAHAAAGRPVLALGMGVHMLGDRLDPAQAERGLGLLPLTVTNASLLPAQRQQVPPGAVRGVWSALSGLRLEGDRLPMPALQATEAVHELAPGLLWQSPSGEVLGCALQGWLEQPEVLQALFGAVPPDLDGVFDRLADVVAGAFVPGALEALLS